MLPVTQFVHRPGLIDLAKGYPHPDALPVAAWAEAYARAVRRFGPDALMYGAGCGPGPLIDWLSEHLGRTDGPAAVPPAHLFVTAGASHALELICTLLVRPGDAVLVDAPTYHFALRILADHSDRLVPAPADARGVDPVATAALVRRLRGEGRRVPLFYLVPTFNNPSGRSLPPDRRAALVAELAGLTTIVEDDTYRELGYDAPAPPSLYALAGGAGVVRVGSFAKTVAPGLRLGWITAAPQLVEALGSRGYVDSGGGVNHATAMAMAEFGATGYAAHVAGVRARYAVQRDHLLGALARYAPGVEVVRPAGGWFAWLTLPPGTSAPELLPRAEAAGVSFVPGPTFHVDGGGTGHARVSFAMLDPEPLAEGARRLGSVLAS